MTAPSTQMVSVTTEDATPTQSKFKISGIAGYSTATIVWKYDGGQRWLRPGVGVYPGATQPPRSEGPEPDGPLPGFLPDEDEYVAAIRIVEGANRLSKPLVRLGAVCGIDRCGACKPLRLYKVATGQRSNVIDRSQIPEATGDITFTIFTLFEPEGWV